MTGKHNLPDQESVGCEVIRNCSCGFFKYIGHSKIQCYIADSKNILEAIFLSVFHRNQFVAITCKFSQNADTQDWDEDTFARQIRKRSPNPLKISWIIFVSFYSSRPFRASNNIPDTAFFKDVEYRNPILSDGHHANIQTVTFQESVSKTVQIGNESDETFFSSGLASCICGRGDGGSNHKCFVNIYTAAGGKYDFHNNTSLPNSSEENVGPEPPSNLTNVKTILSVRVQDATFLHLKRRFQH